LSTLLKIVKIVQNFQKISKLSKLSKIVKGFFFGQFMSPHLSDQMFQRSQVSRVALCMSKVKVLSVSESVSESVTRFAESQIWLTYCLRNYSSVRTQFLGPLCLWQCFLVFSRCFSLFLIVSHCFSLFLSVSRCFSLFLVVSRF
jgi:hypothetical protein